MMKQFLRVKQIADQTFLRAEKSDALTEDLLSAEKRVDCVKATCQATQKKIAACLNIDHIGSEASQEKRLKKIPQVLLGSSLEENGSSFSKNSVLGDILTECGKVQNKLGYDLLEYCNQVEKAVLKPISKVLDNEVHNISKLRKQLGKLVLDMDSARTRFQTAERQSLQANSSAGKVDNIKEELEEASIKVEQCRDQLATEMFSLISREPQIASALLQLNQLQAAYHRSALAVLDASLPKLDSILKDFPQKPVYGCALEEHLRVTGREVAQVIETCVSFLTEYALQEEGLLRIAGSASKLKKIKSAFDAGIELDADEYLRDPHSVSGALKSYLRELPEPLMTYSLYEEWMNAAKLPDFDSRLQSLWKVLHSLPEINFFNLRYVIRFLSKLYESADVNKMSSQNIAIVMAPNLIWSPNEDPVTLGMSMTTASLHTSIVDMLVSYCDWFFPENGEMSAKPSVIPNESPQHNSCTEDDNNSLHANSVMPPPPSPGACPKNLKKPAAPPPPLIDLSPEQPSEDPTPLKRVDESEVTLRHDKPYCTYSLDRKSNRRSVERPTVPPPERPPSKVSPPSNEPSNHVRSSSKGNRFDFLTNQGTDKAPPPERPPRSVPTPPVSANQVETGQSKPTVVPPTANSVEPPPVSNSTAQSKVVQPGSPEVPTSPSQIDGGTRPEPSPPPVAPRPAEKPPRPQPPVKPKIPTHSENTSL